MGSTIVDKIFEQCTEETGLERITARTLYSYCISPFMVYCERFVSEEKKDPLSRYQELLFEQGLKHEEEVLQRGYPTAQKLTYENPREGFRLLLEAMSEGTGAICSCPAFYLPEGLVGVFDLLERKDGRRFAFGPYHYVVKEVKLAKNIQNHHVYQAMLYNYMLGKIQGCTPATFYVINRDHEEIEIPYREEDLFRVIGEVRQILAGKCASPTFGACIWPWETYTNEQAKEHGDVSIVAGVGPSFKEKLVQGGILTAAQLAEADSAGLTRIKGIGPAVAKKFSLGAKALQSGTCFQTGSCEFPSRQTEIFLDLEGTGEQIGTDELIAMDYLIGVLVRKDGKDEYLPFLADDLTAEGKMFSRFIEWLTGQEDFIIYHWHHYERTHLKRLAEKYPIPAGAQELLFNNMRDLYKDATSSFVFPTTGNGLKVVARYMGYQWRHEDINALESIAVYFEYIQDPSSNRQELEKVIDYNEDDCRATMLVKDWLAAKVGAK